MKTRLVLYVVPLLAVLSLPCSATVFDLGPGLTNLETVTVGDTGNAPDTRYATPGFGAVSHAYNVGTYEVTAAQYTEFLSRVAQTDTYGLYNESMWSSSYGCKIQRSGSSGSYTYSVASDWANRPVNYVNYWDACRFANWLHNGQPTGLQTAATTERGVYVLDGYTGADGRAIGRGAGWKWAVASEDEWYKAAYYKAGGTNAGYWDYPTQSDLVASNDLMNPDPGNNANFYQDSGLTISYPYYRTNVGEFENSESAYGTFDQAGNVWEWNGAVLYEGSGFTYRGVRGGGWYGMSGESTTYLRASYRVISYRPTDETSTLGFRVVQAVPEPSSFVALGSGILALAGMIRRRR